MNYYEILKVSQKATDTEIKSSYKELVKKYHPDLYVGDKDFAEKKIKEINEAYDILSNPESKKEYDEYLNPQPTVTYTQNSYSKNTYSNTYNNNSNPQYTEPKQQSGFGNFISEKFDLLNKKTQIKIFILAIIAVLAVFLINLIQLKQYYLTGDTNYLIPANTEIPEDDSDNIIEDENIVEDDFVYEESNDFESIDEFIYDLFEKYEENEQLFFDSNTIYEDTL